MARHLIIARVVQLPLIMVALATPGCVIPGMGTLFEKGVAEYRGGRGEVRGIAPLPSGPVLDRFRSVKVLRVERSSDAGPIPSTLPKVVETEILNAIRDTKLFAGRGAPTLLIRTRLTTHWPAEGMSQAVSAYSEILARVEFLEEGMSAPPLGVYYVRGVSTAIARKTDDHLGRGLAAGVLEVIGQHRTPAKPADPPTRAAESMSR